jgi:hypothetical protein
MIDNQSLLEQLQQLLSWKKSKKFYANKLGITEAEVDQLLQELNGKNKVREEAEVAEYVSQLEETIIRFEEDILKGTGEITLNTEEEIKTLEDLIKKTKIDTSVWDITKYVQNYWGNKDRPSWQVKAWLSKKKDHQLFQDRFIEFLTTYDPKFDIDKEVEYNSDCSDGCLVINKQDAHFNKYDVNGQNDIKFRFTQIFIKTKTILRQAKMSNNLVKIEYIIGSDEFNSEWTNMTTKGTPQQNLLSYHESFKAICKHEIDMILLLLSFSENVSVTYVAGNHDEFVGWHMVHWLKAVFNENEKVKFNYSPEYRKYVSFGTSAMMFNHGDAIKPSKLASIFPIEYKEYWSKYSNYYIFTGDKHHEMSHDFNGIKFYQIPAFSNSKSLWDEKNGHVCSKGEVTAFLIDEFEGMTNIFKQYL